MERTGVKRGNLFHQSNHSQLILLNSQKDENLQDDISLTSFQQSNQSISYSNRSKPQNQYLEKITDDINESQSPEKNNDMDEYNNIVQNRQNRQNRIEENGTNQNNFNKQILDNISDDFAKKKSITKSPDQNQSSFLQIEETKKQSSENDIQQFQQNFQQLQQQQNSLHDSIDRYSSKQVNQNLYPNQRQQLLNGDGDGNGYEEDESSNKQEDRYYGTFNYYENYGKSYSRNKYSNYKMNSMNQSKANQQIVKDRINKIIRNKIEIQNEEMQVQKNIQNILRQEQEEQMKNNEFRQFIQKIKLKHFFTMIANNLESRRIKRLTKQNYILLKETVPFELIQKKQYFDLQFTLQLFKKGRFVHVLQQLPKISPTNIFSLLMNLIDCLLIVIILFITHMNLFFEYKYYENESIKSLMWIAIIFFIIQAWVKINTGIFKEGRITYDQQDILKQYNQNLRNQDLFCLLISIILLIFLSNIHSMEKSNYQYIYGVLFFWKVKTLLYNIKIIEHKCLMSGVKSHYILLFKMQLQIGTMIHMIACIWNFIQRIEIKNLDATNTWIQMNQFDVLIWYEKYVQCYYWATSVLMLIGSTGDTFYETLYTTIILFFTVGIFAYVLENISQTINKLTKDSAQYKTNLETLNIFMKNKSLDQQTQTKVRQQLEHSYKANQQITINQQARFVLEQLPDNLSVQIQNQINSALVQKFKPLCRNFSDKTLELVCKNSNIFSEVSYVAQETILNQNEQQDIYLYYIVAGKVELFVQEQQQQDESKRLHVFQELQEGDLFCLDNFFTGQPPKYSARSTVYSNICKIKRSGFLNVLKQNPQEHEKFHYIKDQILNCGKTKYFIKQCKICQNSNHFEDDCNLLVYRPKKLILAYKNNMENRVKQERQRYFRSISRQEVISAYAMIDNNEILNEHFREKYPDIYPDSDDLYTSYSDTTYTYETSDEDDQEQYGNYKAQVQRISKSFNIQQQSNLQNMHMNSILNNNQARESNLENQQIQQQTQLPSMNHLGCYIQENEQQQNASGQFLNESQDQNDTSMQTLDVRQKKNTTILLNQSQNLSQQQSPQIQKDQIQPQLINNQSYVQSQQPQSQQQPGSQQLNNFLSNQQLPQQQQQFLGQEPQFNASYLQFEIFTTIKQIISNQIKHQTNILKKQQHKQNKELNMFLQKQSGGQNPQFNKKIYSKSRTQNERSTEKNPSGYLSSFLRNKKKKQTMNKKPPTPFQQIFQNNNINFFQNSQQQNNSSQLQNSNQQQQIEQTNNQKNSNNEINNNTNNTNNNINNNDNNKNNNMQDSKQETSPTKVRFQQQQKKMSQNYKKMTLNKPIEIPNLAQQRPYDENEILFLEFDQQHNFSIYYPTYNIVYLLKLFRESLDEKGNQKKIAHARESKFRMNNLLYKEVHGKKVKKDSKKKKNKLDNTQTEQ